MYTVAVRQDFIAEHFLVGGDWGSENERHPHDYQVEVRLEGSTLDEHGFLIDISDIEMHLRLLVAYFGNRVLNELPEFKGLNPSIEHFARIFHQALSKRILSPSISAISVKIWEGSTAWASYREER